MSPFHLTLQQSDGAARAGVFSTPHGEIETPAFMVVGTQGAVRAMLNLKRRKIFRDMRHVLNRVVGALNNPKEIPLRDLTDHAPINYVSALR